MPAPPAPAPRPEKTMSSRLLTMKFMQRAAASSPSPSQPATKRARLSSDGTTAGTPASDLEAIQAALDAEEAKRTAALDRQAAEAGETRWVLSFLDQNTNPNGEERSLRKPLTIVNAGFAGIDSAELEEPGRETAQVAVESPALAASVGRRSFGKFNRKVEQQQQQQATSDDGADSISSDSGDDDGSDPKSRHRSSKSSPAHPSPARRTKEINLNKLASISGGGGSGGGGGLAVSKDTQCYGCGGRGHIKSDCPQRSNGQGKGKGKRKR
ncbi:MAG: hypothetical protein M1819_005875 [Sarea resinae]|nr:MAG: hypothetical protein M1819_005875 [Sarea resinae]